MISNLGADVELKRLERERLEEKVKVFLESKEINVIKSPPQKRKYKPAKSITPGAPVIGNIDNQ